MMNGITIFLLGAVAISNFGLIYYLMSDGKSKKSSSEKPEPDNSPTPPVSHENSGGNGALRTHSRVGKSKTVIDAVDVEAFIDKKFAQMEKRMIELYESKLGDVNVEDVEFGKSDEAPEAKAAKDDANVSQQNDARMTKEQEEASFEDIRDVDPDMISAPSASGVSMDEIEKSVSDANNPDATYEEKIAAAEVLRPLADTNLIDLFAEDPEINAGVMECMEQDFRERLAMQTKRKVSKVKEAPKVTKTKSDNTDFYIPPNINDFDPASLI